MVVSPHGDCFIKVVDSSREIKLDSVIASIIGDVIDEIGEINVVHVVIMDNATNCRAIGKLLEHCYPP